MNKDDFHFYASDVHIAHRIFFSGAHANEPAPFHRQIVEDWHSDLSSVLIMAFRGSAKSTLAEEAITLEVCLRKVKNVLILGESEARAAERLAAIKHQFEYNELLCDAFDIGPGDPWQATQAVTSTGVMMQAYGRGQSLRGVKYLNERPDFILLDDVEDKESGSVATEEARAKTRSWFAGTVVPALAPGGRLRMAATPLHPRALAPTLAAAERSWTTRVFPIIYRGTRVREDGGLEWLSAWPDRYPLSDILKLKLSYQEIGESETFAQEYLCQSVDAASRAFTPDMIVVEPRPFPAPSSPAGACQSLYAIYDPARTTNIKSATTGKCVASWEGNRIIVWEASAKKWMPDEIVADIFAAADKYSLTAVGVEENGLNEWLLQPIRAEQMRRGQLIPLRPLRAPKGKLDFIRGLQPYFASRSVIFTGHFPELIEQLMGFPTGPIDAPNALAYMLRMKLGLPVYDNFLPSHVDPSVVPRPHEPFTLAVNSSTLLTSGALLQLQSGRLVVLADWLADGDAGQVLSDIVQEALVVARAAPASFSGGKEATATTGVRPELSFSLIASPRHFDEYSVYGLRAAARKAGFELQRGAAPVEGREEVRTLLKRVAHGRTAFAISPRASWSARAFAGGFARNADDGLPLDNAYAVLVEPVEAYAGLMRASFALSLDNTPHYAYTEDGRRYISALRSPAALGRPHARGAGTG